MAVAQDLDADLGRVAQLTHHLHRHRGIGHRLPVDAVQNVAFLQPHLIED